MHACVHAAVRGHAAENQHKGNHHEPNIFPHPRLLKHAKAETYMNGSLNREQPPQAVGRSLVPVSPTSRMLLPTHSREPTLIGSGNDAHPGVLQMIDLLSCKNGLLLLRLWRLDLLADFLQILVRLKMCVYPHIPSCPARVFLLRRCLQIP